MPLRARFHKSYIILNLAVIIIADNFANNNDDFKDKVFDINKILHTFVANVQY